MFVCATAQAKLEFTFHKLESGVDGPTILVIGGIQGDEPGGFHAASLLVTDYKIKKGSIWVVPNLNFESIIYSSRGINGDMNRKFAAVEKNDPDFEAVKRVKELIKHPDVSFVFNLHDGSGFYRKNYIDSQHSPNRWGQCVIIDQEQVSGVKFGEIGDFSRNVIETVNDRLLNKKHVFDVKNTHTRDGNEEMSKTLTYYAIKNGKPAVGLEASKSLNKGERVYYHLLALESYLKELGIEFERSFDLKPDSIQAAINSNLRLAMFGEKLNYVIDNARRSIYFVPLEKDAEIEYKSNNPLVAVTNTNNKIKVRYGNRNITSLKPDYFPYDSSLESIDMKIDGKEQTVELGTIIQAVDTFEVKSKDGYRVNVIGWKKPEIRNEVDVPIKREDILSRFSVDRRSNIFRVEIYKDEYFSGMVLVNFGSPVQSQVKYINPSQSQDEIDNSGKQVVNNDKLSLLNQGTGR